MKTFVNKAGLLNAHANDPNTNENTFLYSLTFIIKYGYDKNLQNAMYRWIEKMYNKNGMYDNVIIDENTHDSDIPVSRDQLLAYCIWSKLSGTLDFERIWEGITWGSYDNTKPLGTFSIKRLLHPMDTIYIGLLNQSVICYCFIPLLWVFALATFIRHYKVRHGNKIVKTDGEILWFLKWAAFPMPGLQFFCNMLIKKRFGSWNNVFRTYYKDIEHPNNTGRLI